MTQTTAFNLTARGRQILMAEVDPRTVNPLSPHDALRHNFTSHGAQRVKVAQ